MNHCRVLLADDEAAILEGYKLLFDWEKYQCEIAGTAMDGQEAVEKARELKPDIVIMDINLPKLNGLEAIRAIQDTAPGDHPIYMIVVTGYDEFSYCQEALRLRVSDFLLKPIDFDVFGEVIEGVVKKVMENPNRQVVLSDTLKKIVDYVNENLSDEDMRLTLLAENMNMIRITSASCLKKELGCGYHAYLNQVRVEKAKKYLRQTNEPITVVAELVGFSDYRIFTKIFKGIVGVTPRSSENKIYGR